MMTRGRFRHVPIVADGTAGGKIIGVLDVAQLLQGALAIDDTAYVRA